MVYNEVVINDKLNHVEYNDMLPIVPMRELVFKENHNLKRFFLNFFKTNYNVTNLMENSRFDESNKYQNLKDQKTYNLLDLKKRTKFLKLEEEEFLYMKDELPMYEIIEEKRERLHSDQFEDSIDFHHYFEKTITVDNLQLEQY